MNKHFFHFLSDTPCVLSINGIDIGQIDNQSRFELDVLSKRNKMYITYEPISETSPAIPYTFLIDTQTKTLTTNQYVRVIPFPNNHYDIIMKPFYYYQIDTSKLLYNGQVGKYFVSITTDTQTNITIYSGAAVVFNIRTQKFSGVKVSERLELLIITGLIDEKTYHLLIIDTQNFSIIYNDTSNSIEENLEEIITVKRLNTILKHLVVCKVKFTTKKREEFCMIDESLNSTLNADILLPMTFLECIQYSDMSSASKYLAESLQKAEIQQFKAFFGDFKEIYLNRHNTNPHKINYTLYGDSIHNFSFLINDNKITEILEENI